ncbi:MAG TPA: hypothetical protein VM492_18360, partial [Sumerlaeia bacterium]|nr:hypothetical protein [Sumerlaeia bacterium]
MSPMVFRNYGGNYQLRVETPEDLESAHHLDEARWASTSAPVTSFSCDPAFLAFLDADRNGRIRTDEMKTGIEWLFRRLANRERLAEQTDALRLDDVDASHDEGRQLRAAAEQILANLDLAGSPTITLAQVRDRQNIMSSAASNGDGVIPPSAVDDPETSALASAVASSVGAAPDASGQTGITSDLLETFLEEARQFLKWEETGRVPPGEERTEILPWGAATAEAWRL